MLESLLNKVAGQRACNFIKMRIQHECFQVKFLKFLARPFFYKTAPVAASVCKSDSHIGTIIQTGITCKNIPLKKPI